MRGWAMDYLIEDRARTPSELSAEVAIAIDWLRRESYERAIEILSSVMVDLRMMERGHRSRPRRGRRRDRVASRHITDGRVRAKARPFSL